MSATRFGDAPNHFANCESCREYYAQRKTRRTDFPA